MTKNEIECLLIEEIIEILELNGCPEIKVTPSLKPLEDLGVFDSLNAIEVLVSISKKLDFELDIDSFGINCKTPNPRLLSVEEIARNIFEIITGINENNE